MIQVTELGYMGIGVKDLDAWKHFATGNCWHGIVRGRRT